MTVDQLSRDEWRILSEDAHKFCFSELRPSSLDRIDFALLAQENLDPVAYMTLREIDSETVYLQYGGSFRPGTIHSFRGYKLMLNRLKEMGFKRGQTYIENTNTPMLKFALKMGWLITGVRVFQDKDKTSILTEQTINFEIMEE